MQDLSSTSLDCYNSIICNALVPEMKYARTVPEILLKQFKRKALFKKLSREKSLTKTYLQVAFVPSRIIVSCSQFPVLVQSQFNSCPLIWIWMCYNLSLNDK